MNSIFVSSQKGDMMNNITKISDIQDDSLLTIQEVAELLRVDECTVRRWATNGSLEVIVLPHVGRRKLYRVRGIVIKKLLA